MHWRREWIRKKLDLVVEVVVDLEALMDSKEAVVGDIARIIRLMEVMHSKCLNRCLVEVTLEDLEAAAEAEVEVEVVLVDFQEWVDLNKCFKVWVVWAVWAVLEWVVNKDKEDNNNSNKRRHHCSRKMIRQELFLSAKQSFPMQEQSMHGYYSSMIRTINKMEKQRNMLHLPSNCQRLS